MWAELLGPRDSVVQIITVADKPPSFVFYDGVYYQHCGTRFPQEHAVYRNRPFGDGQTCKQTMPPPQPNQTRTKDSLKRVPYVGREW
jgi:hypothetical protein